MVKTLQQKLMKQKMDAFSISRLITIQQLRKFGHHLNEMIMPNLSLFIAWGLLSLLANHVSGELHRTLTEVCDWMIRLLLPILISYLGGKASGGQKGAVTGAIASLGIIAASDVPQIVGAMLVGPVAGAVYSYSDKWLSPRLKAGYEMLAGNLLVGMIGGICCIVGIVAVEPLIGTIHQQLADAVFWLIKRNALPFVNLLVEPLKVLFFNNAINHGILTPLGIEFSRTNGRSILFLMEANPGPGVGILLANILFAKKSAKVSAGGALMIQAFGGIHEIYFPFVLMQPRLFLAVMAGGTAGTLVFQLLDAGLTAPVSPGSLLVIFANTPRAQLLGVAMGIFISTAVTFVCAALLMKLPEKSKKTEKQLLVDERKAVVEKPLINHIIFACDSGMGSSAMGAVLLRKALQEEIPVDYGSIYTLEKRQNQLIIVQKELASLAREKVSDNEILPVDHFLEIEDYLPEIKRRIHQSVEVDPVHNQTVRAQASKNAAVVFLYEKDRRGSQTMGMTVFRQLAEKYHQSLFVEKKPVEQIRPDQNTIYITTKNIAARYQLAEKLECLIVVDHLVINQEYEKLLRGEDCSVFVTKRETAADRTH